MKKILLAAAATFVASAPAFATDIAKAPPAPPLDPWTGAYLGIHVGAGANTGGGSTASLVPFQDVTTSVPAGVVGGVHAGYGQKVNGNFYAGLEGDLDISAVDSGGNGLITATSKNKWLTSIRARVGYIPVSHLLLFATGGWGWSGGQFAFSDPMMTTTTSPTVNGFVWGGGLEVALSQNWLARAEYLQYDFGSTTVAAPVAAFTLSDKVQVIRGGLTYKF